MASVEGPPREACCCRCASDDPTARDDGDDDHDNDGGGCGSEWGGFGDDMGNAGDADVCAVSTCGCMGVVAERLGPPNSEARRLAMPSWLRLFPTEAVEVVLEETELSKLMLSEMMLLSSPPFSWDKTLRALTALS